MPLTPPHQPLAAFRCPMRWDNVRVVKTFAKKTSVPLPTAPGRIGVPLALVVAAKATATMAIPRPGGGATISPLIGAGALPSFAP